MKVMKAMKRLKFWSRKKRKKTYFLTESLPPPSRPAPPPPPLFYEVHSQYEPLLPSAPPLPPWLEYDMQCQEMLSTSNVNSASASIDRSTSESHVWADPESQGNTSYQPHIVPKPVYDTPLVPQLNKLERSGGGIGCVVSFGAHLVRCVFPCFHVREEVGMNQDNYAIK